MSDEGDEKWQCKDSNSRQYNIETYINLCTNNDDDAAGGDDDDDDDNSNNCLDWISLNCI